MEWPFLLVLVAAVALGLMLAERVERRRESLPALRLLAELLGLSLLVGAGLAAAWSLLWGGADPPNLLPFALATLPALSRLTEAPALRGLSRPLRWTVLGAVLLLPLLGVKVGVALLRPASWGAALALLPWMAALGAASGLIALLWTWLERVWILPGPGERSSSGRCDR